MKTIIKYINSSILNFINNIKINNEKIPILGRWCHINVPKCNYNTILRKIDMANQDNNLCYKNKK